ncbi:ROK family protein [Streptomyces sp. NRRL S-31]|uniref:ROK family protein n=1 Tax=Streptomyces sp. NRRL S-31 TaxID=1463898 RepID=UPI0004CBCE64|nr:ROK family protein [Streptomyces sp. NRRL S-31]AZM68331.1 kinase [Streptomyces sp.]
MTHLGIDVGGTKVALRLRAASGEHTEAVFRWPGERTVEADLAALAAHTRALLGAGHETVEAVGVAMPATLDVRGRVATWPGRPFWRGVRLRDELAALLPGTRVDCADDGDLAALAEADAADCRNLVYLGVGTGIGGGIVLDGRLVPGTGRGSCEVGHVIVDRAGERCDCGRHGCVQAIASGPATLRRAARLRGAPVEFTELRDAFTAGRDWAVAALDESAAALAAAAVSLAELVHPERVVVGGGFAAGIPGQLTAVEAHVSRLARPGTAVPGIHPARLGGLSSLHGALLLARSAPTAPTGHR